jgi:transcription termination factor Rho
LNQNSEKKRVRGIVDRVANGIVVILIPDPNYPDATKEVYLPIELIKKKNLKEGDKVTVYV